MQNALGYISGQSILPMEQVQNACRVGGVDVIGLFVRNRRRPSCYR